MCKDCAMISMRLLVLTVVFPQRFHIFLPRFRLRILDISSCDDQNLDMCQLKRLTLQA